MSDYDLRYLESVNQILEQYLLSKDLFWLPGVTAAPGEPPYPSLTPGNLLLALKKAEKFSDQDQEKVRLQRQNETLEKTKTRWKSAWENKCTQEYHNRLRLFGNFLDEYMSEPEKQYDRYRYEVFRRVILELLDCEIVFLEPAARQLCTILDQRLRGIFIPDRFIWAPELADAFPRDHFWYLYGMIKD